MSDQRPPRTWILGDIHGCLQTLERLLEHLGADLALDRFCFVGDIINRGPASLASLRFVMNLGDRAIVTLGNHDLHLLAVLHGLRRPGKRDTISNILAAQDRDAIVDWLRTRPLLHEDPQGFVMVHAGIHPHWSLATARTRARELERALRADDYTDFLAEMYGNEPSLPDDASTRIERLRVSVNVFTRMRFCHLDGQLEFNESGPPMVAADGLLPWYAVPERIPIEPPIYFGHWSAHPAMAPPRVIPTDRGCVWGGYLAGFDVSSAISRSVPAVPA